MGKIIWIINQYASHLEERHLNLANNFAQSGYRVIVITSSFHHGSHEYIFSEKIKEIEKNKGVYFVYLKSKPMYNSNGGKRIINMLHFCYIYLCSLAKIASQIGKPDYVIASSAPPFMWEIGYLTARKYKSKFIVEFRDIWPLSLIEVQGVNPRHPLIKIFSIIEKRAYRRADAIVGTMPYAYKHVCDDMGYPKYKFHWMPNGLNIEKADKERQPLPTALEEYLNNHWCCIYIGSIVKSESVDYIIDAWKKIKDNDICLVIIGKGNMTSIIDNMIKEIGNNRIIRFDPITKEQIPNALEKAHCCLAAIPHYSIYEFGLSMNKLSDYLYSGTPVVFACDYDNVVKEAGGVVVPFGDKQAMADAIEMIKKENVKDINTWCENGKKIIEEQYDYRIIAAKYIEMMENL